MYTDFKFKSIQARSNRFKSVQILPNLPTGGCFVAIHEPLAFANPGFWGSRSLYVYGFLEIQSSGTCCVIKDFLAMPHINPFATIFDKIIIEAYL